MKCESCAKGHNGRNGNGYQPRACNKNKSDPVIPLASPFTMGRPEFRWLRNRWTRFQIWRLNRYADGLLKEAEYHKHAAKTHTAASSMFWSKASDIRVAAKKMLGGLS